MSDVSLKQAMTVLTSAGIVTQAIALTRSRFSMVRTSTRRPTGVIIAPPMPCTMRATTKPSSGPSGVCDQSLLRMSAPISPPPTNQSLGRGPRVSEVFADVVMLMANQKGAN